MKGGRGRFLSHCDCHHCMVMRNESSAGVLVLCGFCGKRDCPNAHDHRIRCTTPQAVKPSKVILLPDRRMASQMASIETKVA